MVFGNERSKGTQNNNNNMAHKNNDPADSEDRGHCLSMVSCESKRLGAVQADEAKV
jgi:hypothetical protein